MRFPGYALLEAIGILQKIITGKQQVDPRTGHQQKEIMANSDERKKSTEDYLHTYLKQSENVFTLYYAKLCKAIPVEEVLPNLVSGKIITVQEMEDILAEKTTFRQTRALLNGPIWRAINGGYPEAFIELLRVLHPIPCCKMLCEDIFDSLKISTEVIPSESREFK